VMVTFRNYMTTVYEEEKQSVSDGKTEGNNLMTSLVRASQAVMASSENGLAEQEIYGNIFVFNFAGHDATANTLASNRYPAGCPGLDCGGINAVFGD
jgi:cytochrome P450